MKSPKLRILIAAAIYPPDPGGPATHAARYERDFDALGHKVRLLVFSRLLWLPFGVRHLVFLLRMFQAAAGVDVIYAQDAMSTGWASFMAAFVLRRKLVYRIGGDMVWERALERGGAAVPIREFYRSGDHKKSRLFAFQRFSLARADHIIVPSPLLIDIYTKHYNIAPERIVLIPNPVPSPNPDLRGSTLGVEPLRSEEARTLVFSSRLVSYKNLDLFLDAFAAVYESIAPAKVILIGDGPERGNLKTLVKRLGLVDQVIFPGRLPHQEALEHIRAARATIAPALTEFNPNFVLEGFAHGVPTIMSQEHGLPFVMPKELLFDPMDRASLEERLRYIYSPAGYKEAKELVALIPLTQTWDKVVAENLRVLEEAQNGQIDQT